VAHIDSERASVRLKEMKPVHSIASILICLCVMLGSFTAHAADNPGREFMMSCTYGVLAGTLVGAASLAFTNKPGDNINRLARGASLGLYAGILLGVYVVYIVPGLETPDEEPAALGFHKPRLDVLPTFGLKGSIDGAQAEWTITRF
jgi:uncharacterized membrane protein YgdD (TMEM256/DUF423 family)